MRSLSVQSKLLLAFTALTLLGIAVVSWTAYATARASLLTSVERQLVGLQRAKTGIVRSMLTATRNEVLALSGSKGVSDAARLLAEQYRELSREPVTPSMKDAVRAFYTSEFEPALAARTRLAPATGAFLPTTEAGWYLHYHYLVNGTRPYGPRRGLESTTDQSPFGAAVATARQALGPSLERLGLQNVLLVDPASLEVIFSYDQSSIVGTALDGGPYAGSGVAALARALRHTQDVDDYRAGGFRSLPPDARPAECVHRQSRVRRSDDGGDPDRAVPDRANCEGAVERQRMGGRRAGQNRRDLPAGARPHDARRLAVPRPGSRGIPRGARAVASSPRARWKRCAGSARRF